MGNEELIRLTCSAKTKGIICEQQDVLIPIAWIDFENKCKLCGEKMISPELWNHENEIKKILNG